jgi:hypothetical protein
MKTITNQHVTQIHIEPQTGQMTLLSATGEVVGAFQVEPSGLRLHLDRLSPRRSAPKVPVRDLRYYNQLAKKGDRAA